MNLIRVPTYYTPSFLQPSLFSITGSLISTIEEDHLPESRIPRIASRVFITLVIALARVLDFCIWAAMTISIVGMIRIGFLNHIINLISIVATPIFALTVLFGYYPQLSPFRTSTHVIVDNLFTAIYARDAKRVRSLTKSGIETLKDKTFLSNSFLVFASSIPQNTKVISILAQAKFLDRNDRASLSCLLFASRTGSPDNISALISEGIDPNRLSFVRNSSRFKNTKRSLLPELLFEGLDSTYRPYLCNHLFFYSGKDIDLQDILDDTLNVNPKAPEKTLLSIQRLILHGMVYSHRELQEFHELCNRLLAPDIRTEEYLKIFDLLDEQVNSSKRINPYYVYLQNALGFEGMRNNDRELRYLKRITELFLEQKPTIAKYKSEAEERRATALLAYFPPSTRMHRDVVTVVARYWCPGYDPGLHT